MIFVTKMQSRDKAAAALDEWFRAKPTLREARRDLRVGVATLREQALRSSVDDDVDLASRTRVMLTGRWLLYDSSMHEQVIIDVTLSKLSYYRFVFAVLNFVHFL